MDTEVAVGILAFVLMIVAAFLAMAETSLSRIDRFRAKALLDEGRRGGHALCKIVESPDRFYGYINSVLLLLLATQIALSTSIAYVCLHHLHDVWFVLAVILEVIVIFVLAEAMPKTWAVQHTERTALMCSPIIAGLARIAPMRFITRPLIWSANVLLPGKGLRQGPFVYEQQMLALADSAAEDKAIESEEHRLIHSVIEFRTTIAREVMVPRPDMITIAETDTVGQAIELALEKGYSRIPVHGPENDEIVGVLFTKDLMRSVRDGQDHIQVSGLMRPGKYIPETKRVAELMAEMQAEKTHMAIVIDEYGTVVGLITLEDLVEEVVGEIVDEYDTEQAPSLVQLSEGEWQVDARMSIDEVFESTSLKLPHGEWDTVGGLLINAFGRVPSVGDSTEVDDLRVTVDAVTGRRVVLARIERLVPAGEVDSQTQIVEAG